MSRFTAVSLLAVVTCAALPARADRLAIGYSGNADGIEKAARIGYSSADGTSGAQLRFGVRYLPDPFRLAGNVQVEPLLALTIADERAQDLDRKEVQAGARIIAGTYAYVDATLDAGVERRTDTSYKGLRVASVFIAETIAPPFMAATEYGWLFRPKAGVYVEQLRGSADPVAQPNGRASSAWLGMDLAWSPLSMPRHTAGYRNRFVRDFSTSGERMRGNHRFHAASYTYRFYDAAAAPAGKPRVALTVERAVGADPVEGSRKRHATTAIYLGFQL